MCKKIVLNLEKHIKTKHGPEESKKFKCKICGKGFILRDKLASHLIFHSDVKPYECKSNCGFAKGNIQKHENSRKRQEGSNFCGPKYRLNPTHSNSQSDRVRAEEIQERQKRMEIKRSSELLRMLGEQLVLLV